MRTSLRTLCKMQVKTERSHESSHHECVCDFFRSYNYFKILLCTAIKNTHLLFPLKLFYLEINKAQFALTKWSQNGRELCFISQVADPKFA